MKQTLSKPENVEQPEAKAGSSATTCSRLVVSFSGGRSSAVMLDQILERWGDSREIVICFANTGKEEEETLRFVDAVDRNFCRPRGYKVHWLEAIIHHGERKAPTAKEVTYKTANRTGAPFEEAIKKHGIFNKSYPNCTGRLKDEPLNWWVRNVIGWEKGSYDTAIGIRADEIDRVSARKEEMRWLYPLADWGYRKRDVSHYMERFDWDLKLPGDHWGNCDVCWKKSLRKLMTRAKEDPSVFAWWGHMERKYGMVTNGEHQEEPRAFFREGRSAQDIIALAHTKDFEPYEDEKYDNPELFDKWWDVGAGCGESCEIGADE